MRIKHILLTSLVSLSLVSCNYLDFDETSGLKTKEDMYKYFGTTESMLTNVYSYMPSGLFAVNLAMRDCGSDDAEFALSSDMIQYMNNGSWSPIKTVDNAWGLYYGIRAANSFIDEIQNVDFSRYQYEGGYKNWMKKLKYFSYEARVLRAYYFFELARRYGDIAMPLTVLDKEGANTIGKTKFADVINYIVSECTEVAKNLPDSYQDEPDKQIGRMNRGFALALKSKALLYAASELHNPSMNTELWKASAKAAWELIDTKLYSLDPKETANNLTSKELVMMVMESDSYLFEQTNFPIRFTEGKRAQVGIVTTATFPSQNLVDAFQTINGYPVTLGSNGWICEDPAFNPQKPYENRDPRFYRAILANGMAFKGSTIDAFAGGLDDAEVTAGGSPTGYFLRKYIQESTSFIPDKEVMNKHHWVVYRYAETLLTYAESMVYAFPNNVNYTDVTYPQSALWALNQVRTNAGMPAIPTCSQEEFIKHLRNEWRVEFAFEDHRFWDVRRWKIGNDTQRELYGVRIIKEDDGKLQFFRTLYETRTWKDCMNLYPIPQSELFINTNLNPQNPGW